MSAFWIIPLVVVLVAIPLLVRSARATANEAARLEAATRRLEGTGAELTHSLRSVSAAFGDTAPNDTGESGHRSRR